MPIFLLRPTTLPNPTGAILLTFSEPVSSGILAKPKKIAAIANKSMFDSTISFAPTGAYASYKGAYVIRRLIRMPCLWPFPIADPKPKTGT